MSAPNLIDRAALVDFMGRVLRNLEANADASESYIRGYRAALDEVKRAASAKVGAARIDALRAEWNGICEAMNVGTYHGTEFDALARIAEIRAEIAEMEVAA